MNRPYGTCGEPLALGSRDCHAEEVVELLGLQHPPAKFTLSAAEGKHLGSFVVPVTIQAVITPKA